VSYKLERKTTQQFHVHRYAVTRSSWLIAMPTKAPV